MKWTFEGEGAPEWEIKEGTKVTVKPIGGPADAATQFTVAKPADIPEQAEVKKRVFQFNRTKSNEFPMKSVKVEIETDRLDEILLAYYIFNSNEDLGAIEGGLAEYRAGTSEVKVAWLNKVLTELKENLHFLTNMKRMASRIEYGPGGSLQRGSPEGGRSGN